VVAFDTTGLPDGATFGPTVGADIGQETIGGTGTGTGGDTGTGTGELGASAARRAGPLKVGQAFGPRYHVIKLLGAGGMGAVYQAWDAELGVAVALKVIRTDRRRGTVSADAEKRFKTELLLARQVTHKHVVRIHDINEIDGIKYITMPYVQGDDLGTVLRRDGKLPIARAMRLARQIAGGLQAAHEAGVVHRDLKPPNIMIGGSGDDEQALIMDFGISASATDETTAGTVIGTLEYMSPEQGTGKAVDARSDLYAFGVILYEMLTGPRPHPATGPERVAKMRERFDDGMPPLQSVDPTIPEPLAHVVTRCLERDADARYQTTAELCGALAALDDAGELIPVPARVTKRMVVAAGVLVAAIVAGTYFIARPKPVVHHDTVPVLIADFDNRANDAAFSGAIEQSLTLALEGSPYITVFRTGDARSIAAQISPDKSTRVTEQVGRLIALREGIKVLLAGAIDKRSNGYRLSLRATDPATDKPIATVAQDVDERDAVLKTVAGMAVKLREALGESKSEMTNLAAAETATAGSLDAMRAFARGQDLLRANQSDDALKAYEEAIKLDPSFGRAYAGMGVIHSNFKQQDKAEAAYAEALKHVDRMTDREKYRTLGGYYLLVVRNYEKAIENYETLVRLFPADTGGHGNLALAELNVGNLPKAIAEVRKILEIYPKSRVQRYNYAMYSMYAGDFDTAIAEGSRVLKETPSFEHAFIPIAVSSLAQGKLDAARDGYAQLERVNALGASIASLGRADLDMYFGRYKPALTNLTAAIAVDEAQKRSPELALKRIVAAEAYSALGNRRQAIEEARKATALSRHEGMLFLAAQAFLQAGNDDEAAKIASTLENMLQRRTIAYARLISGQIAIRQGRLAAGIEALTESQKRYDSWFGRFVLGKTYAEAGHYPEALAELEACVKRRGEATDMLFFDRPTLRYLPPVYYWLARTQEALGVTAEARKNFEQFLNLRTESDTPDPLAADARRRLGSG
jgi:tetratricopeptide (TPR) repeat protein/predicted Ser/Thr protein kinase